MTIRLTSLALSLAFCLALSPLADAQRAGGGSGSFGGGGGSGLGGGRLSGGGFGTGGVSGSRGMGSQGGGMGAMGGMGGMGGGMSQGMGMGSGMGGGMGGMGSQMGFGSTGNQGFIGRDAADVQAMFQAMGAGQGMGAQGANRGGNRGAQGNRGGQGNRGQGNQGTQEQTRSPIRVRVQVAFDYPGPSEVGGPQGFSPTVYDRILEDRRVENFAIAREGTRIVLTGVAADASERLLMARLVSLEPGVSQIDNQMTLAEEIVAPTLPDSEE